MRSLLSDSFVSGAQSIREVQAFRGKEICSEHAPEAMESGMGVPGAEARSPIEGLTS
jgi:hypothetical protein